MPFLRLKTAVASPFSAALPAIRARRASGLMTLCCLAVPTLAHAKPFRAVGVKAWTSGSDTFIRARPSAMVPPVAKVARHTPLYVWGKYNGWYRVETHDHIFGWVYNQYIEAPKGYKVREMPTAKATQASDRTADQTMYGSPELLKKHYAAYGAPGALKGLKKQGVILAAAPKAKPSAAMKTKVLVAKTEVKPRVKTAAKPIQLAAAPRELTPRNVSPVPSAELIERRRIAATKAAAPSFQAAKTEALPQPRREIASALGGKMNGYSAPRVENYNRLETTPEALPRDVESGKIAGSVRGLTPSAKTFARAAADAASQLDTSPAVAVSRQSAPARVVIPVVRNAPAPTAPRVITSASAVQKVVQKATSKPAKKAVAKVAPKSRYATRKERQRELLRAKMGMSNTAPRSVIAPVSPAELMRARQEYLAERKVRLGLPASPEPLTPTINAAPLPVPSGPLGGPNGNAGANPGTPLPPMPPGNIAPTSFSPDSFGPMAYTSSNPLAPLLGDPYILSLAQLKPKVTTEPTANPEAATPNSATPSASASVAAASRGGSPRDRMAPNRGGSPRDRFGVGMANQALSYRGTRYISGAASPNRGFDCSGLVYYLLSQRGFHPPRTAAGYRNWGTGVPKNQLKTGDLLLFANTYKRGISHIGVYMGEGKFVHAANSHSGVRVSSLKEAYYAGKYYGARRPK